MSPAHPQKEQLIAFGQGKLAADESSSVESHLEVCRECCETLLDLKDDTFVGLVRIAKPDGAVADAASVRTDLGADASCVGHDSAHAATLLVQSGEAVSVDELPAELREHPRYRIVELIGRGGMGNVYRAEHRLMNRPVAIKLINSQLIRQPQAVERFRREVQAAAKLSHPNIVAAYDAEQAGDVHFLVMEFVEGTDLASVVKHRGPMSVAEACRCIQQAAAGLQNAHEKGMVHRDIKPHNLMLSDEGQVRILDFGLAGFVQSDDEFRSLTLRVGAASVEESDSESRAMSPHLTIAGSVMGTPDYIAPEQIQDAHSADIRADIYSLGCTLHFLLTGKPPFVADNVIAKLKAHAQEPPPSLTTLRKDVSADLSKVVARMMAKNPAERFQTPAEVAAALAPFAQPAIVPPKRRGRSLIAAALLGAAALLAGVIYVLTDKGEFEITTADDQVAVMLGEKDVKIVDAVTKRKFSFQPGTHPLHSGEYLMDVTELPSGLEFSVPKFTLKRGKEVRVTVRLKSKSDQELLQGHWQPVAAEVMGVMVPEAFIQTVAPSLTFDGDKVIALTTTTSPLGNLNVTGIVRLDPTKTPKTIDIVFLGEHAQTMLGVYRLQDDRLTLCFYVNPDRPELRPADFVTKPANGTDTKLPFSSTDMVTPDLLKKGTNMVGMVTLKRSATAAVPPENPKQAAAVQAAQAWLKLADAGKFDECWEACAKFAKAALTKEQVVGGYGVIRKPLGVAQTRVMQSANSFPQLPGTPPGESIVVQFETTFSIGGKQLEQVTLYWDQDNQWRVAGYQVTPAPSEPKKGQDDPATEQKKQAALTATQQWLKLIDAGQYGEAWDTSAKLNKDGIKRDAMDLAYQGLFQPLGPIKSRELKTNEYKTQLPRAPMGEYAVIQFSTQFTNGRVTETVVLTREADSQWRVSGYFHDEDKGAQADKPAEASSLAALKDSAAVLMYLNDPRNNRGGSVPVALLGREGRVAFRFGTWLVVFEGIACDPKAGILGFSSFNIPLRGSSGEGTIDFGAGDKLPGVLIKFKFANEQNEISINNNRFKLRGKAIRLEFDDKAYDATNSLQTILVARDGSTRLETPLSVKLDAPQAAVRVGQNLIVDPSLEDTPKNQLPSGWSPWFTDGPQSQWEIANLGHSGQRSLKVMAVGTRAVVFANSVPLDRSKRYAIKGWVLFTSSDQDARAMIKFNYFHNGKWLGVHDLVGTTGKGRSWKHLEKTDAADDYPEATLLVPTCHIEGQGTAWFDDLELIAFDRDKLPANFEAVHGKNNRLASPLDFDRWVGEWDATFEVKPNAQSPQDRNTHGTMTTRKVLDDRFLLTHSANESDPTQWLWFLTYDANFAAYRIWIFGSGGEAFERRGQWDAASQMLTLQLVPPSPGVTGQSTDRFIGNDRIESSLFVKSAEGQVTRDNRWSAKKKTPQPKSLAEIPNVAAHVPLPEELSLLNKFAGDWTIRAKSKPSIWLPNGGEETLTEKVAWILGGRFLMARTFNEKDELTSIWLATYEPSEKSNRFWFFNADGSSGQWRVTWDASSRGFHWRSIDMPTGWIGTGFNRWINDDTFDNQALIKDENGRVLLDGTQDKRRKK